MSAEETKAADDCLYLRLYAGRVAWFGFRGSWCRASGEVATIEQARALQLQRAPASVIADVMEAGIDRAALPAEWTLAGPFGDKP